MLIKSHRNGTNPGTETEAVCICSSTLNFKYAIEPVKYLLHNLYKCSFTIITIISVNILSL